MDGRSVGLQPVSSFPQNGWWSVPCLLAGLASFWCYSQVRSARSPARDIVVEPESLDLGSLSPPRRKVSSVTVRNVGPTYFTIHWTSSCECVSVEPSVMEIRPGEACLIRVCADVHDDQIGSLGVLVTGNSPAGQQVANFTVLLGAAQPNDPTSLDGYTSAVRGGRQNGIRRFTVGVGFLY